MFVPGPEWQAVIHLAGGFSSARNIIRSAVCYLDFMVHAIQQ